MASIRRGGQGVTEPLVQGCQHQGPDRVRCMVQGLSASVANTVVSRWPGWARAGAVCCARALSIVARNRSGPKKRMAVFFCYASLWCLFRLPRWAKARPQPS